MLGPEYVAGTQSVQHSDLCKFITKLASAVSPLDHGASEDSQCL
jgi:hypothetical protein